jgi:hypothetical protein
MAMTQQHAFDQADAALVAAVPHPAALQEIDISTFWMGGPSLGAVTFSSCSVT